MNDDTDSNRRWLAFEAEAMPHADRLFRHAMWLSRNRAEAEDLVQETLVQALQSFHRFTPGTNCRARAEDLRPRPEFAAELRARLQPSQAGISRRSVLQSWWALAAGLALAAGGGLFVRNSSSRSRLGMLAREAAGDHQNCAVKFNLAERPIQLEEAGRRYGAPYAALATFVPPGVEGSLDVLERHSCVYEGRRFGHVVFRYRGALTSLLVTAGAPPAAPALVANDPGPVVASLPAGRFVGFVVAGLEPQQVLDLAQALAEPLSRHLS